MFIGHRGLSKPIKVKFISNGLYDETTGYNIITPSDVIGNSASEDLHLYDFTGSAKFNLLQNRANVFIEYHIIGQGGTGGRAKLGNWTGASGQPGEYISLLTQINKLENIRVSYSRRPVINTYGGSVAISYHSGNYVLGKKWSGGLGTFYEPNGTLTANSGVTLIPPIWPTSPGGVLGTRTSGDTRVSVDYVNFIELQPPVYHNSFNLVSHRSYISINDGEHVDSARNGLHTMGPVPGGLLTSVLFPYCNSTSSPLQTKMTSNPLIQLETLPSAKHANYIISPTECDCHSNRIMMVIPTKNELATINNEVGESARGHIQSFGIPGLVQQYKYLPMTGGDRSKPPNHILSYYHTGGAHNTYGENLLYSNHYWKHLATYNSVNINGGIINMGTWNKTEYTKFLNILKSLNFTNLRSSEICYYNPDTVNLRVEWGDENDTNNSTYDDDSLNMQLIATPIHIDERHMTKIYSGITLTLASAYYGSKGLVVIDDIPDDIFTYETHRPNNYSSVEVDPGSCGINTITTDSEMQNMGYTMFEDGVGDEEMATFFADIKEYNDLGNSDPNLPNSFTYTGDGNYPAELYSVFGHYGKGGNGGSLYNNIEYSPSWGRQGMACYKIYLRK